MCQPLWSTSAFLLSLHWCPGPHCHVFQLTGVPCPIVRNLSATQIFSNLENHYWSFHYLSSSRGIFWQTFSTQLRTQVCWMKHFLVGSHRVLTGLIFLLPFCVGLVLRLTISNLCSTFWVYEFFGLFIDYSIVS